jgi:hypothetical protein
MTDIFNDYDESGYRITITGSKTSRIADNNLRDNLRFRWANEFADWSDQKLVNAYDEFAMSEMFGDNDERFLEFCKDFE